VRNAANDTTDVTLAPTEKLRREPSPAPQLTEPGVRRRRHEPRSFEGDIAARELRAQTSLDPVAVPQPARARRRNSAIPMLLRVAGGAALAALAVIYMKGTAPESPKLADDGTRLVQLGTSAPVATPPAAAMLPAPTQVATAPVPEVSRPPAAAPAVPRPPAERAVLPPPAPPAPPAPPVPVRTIDREEAAALYSRGEQLIAVGDVVAARLMFLRAAEGGDARSAFAMGASYDPDMLRKLGVLGVVSDLALAREWYAKASSLGSREAAQRIEMLARLR
jgi:TPR repeat protein